MRTHDITNQVPELKDYNLFGTDNVLVEGIERSAAQWHAPALLSYGAKLGSSDTLQLSVQANQYSPELHTHDRFGNRIDSVSFHPAWHTLLALLRGASLHALPWINSRVGAHVARAAGYFLHAQIEAGSLCPTTMTFAAIPVLRKEHTLFPFLEKKLFSTIYDPRDIPFEHKQSILIGMGMTEKQGGSDVRINTTYARPIGSGGRGCAYTLTGHKWFFSAPMSDAHMVLARTDNGLSCFFVPRWQPDGEKNHIFIQQLKDKLGNRSNSSSEVEFDDAYGIMVGEEGRGIPTIIEMANHTRLDCVIGSAGLMRYALVQAIHHARHRNAFGAHLAEQPLMRNVLVDLALESEAASLLMLRLAQAFETPHDPLQRAWCRIVTPAAKFWICKRALEFTGECMEVWGGNGYVETGSMARMYREAPVNSIWEGSGNIMCLDVLRALEREPEGSALLLEELAHIAITYPPLEPHVRTLKNMISMPHAHQEALARRFVQQLVLTLQGALMLQHAPTDHALAFIHSRSDFSHGRIYGTLDLSSTTNPESLQKRVLERAWPV